MRQGVYSTPVWISRPSQLICPSLDTRDSHGGVQCPAGALPGHRVWRHPWPIRTSDLHTFRTMFGLISRVLVIRISTTYLSYSASAATRQTQTTSSWATTSTEGTTLLKLSHSSLPSSCGTAIVSQSCGAITNLARLPRCTGSTMNACVNTAMPTCGGSSPTCSTSYP